MVFIDKVYSFDSDDFYAYEIDNLNDGLDQAETFILSRRKNWSGRIGLNACESK